MCCAVLCVWVVCSVLCFCYHRPSRRHDHEEEDQEDADGTGGRQEKDRLEGGRSYTRVNQEAVVKLL